jgi:hypothetical protein
MPLKARKGLFWALRGQFSLLRTIVGQFKPFHPVSSQRKADLDCIRYFFTVSGRVGPFQLSPYHYYEVIQILMIKLKISVDN